MADYGRINLSLYAVLGDGDDAGTIPDEVPIQGTVRFVPRKWSGLGGSVIETGYGSTLIVLPVECSVVNGKVQRSGVNHVTLLVPTTGWGWTVEFGDIFVGATPVSLGPMTFPITADTPAKLGDAAYTGTNIATRLTEV